MRQIKFRGWHKKKRSWKGLWIFRGGHNGEYDVSKNEIDILDLSKKWDGVILMQFTGLYDRKGKEIYEGDVVEWNSFENGKERAEVIYSGYMFTLYHTPFNSLPNIALIGEIIGNIYENPELIK